MPRHFAEYLVCLLQDMAGCCVCDLSVGWLESEVNPPTLAGVSGTLTVAWWTSPCSAEPAQHGSGCVSRLGVVTAPFWTSPSSAEPVQHGSGYVNRLGELTTPYLASPCSGKPVQHGSGCVSRLGVVTVSCSTQSDCCKSSREIRPVQHHCPAIVAIWALKAAV